MGKKFCMNCGFGAEMMAGGSAPNFCPKCGNSFSVSLGDYTEKATRSISRANPRKARSKKEEYGEELNDWGETDFGVAPRIDYKTACEQLEISVDMGKSSIAKLGDLVKEGEARNESSFERPRGKTSSKNIQNLFKKEGSSSKNSPDIIGG